MLYSTLEGSPAKINWVKNTQLHLTLKFLGYTPELSNSEVIDHIETITRDVKPFNLTIEETGCFPIPERPRVLWIGVTGDLKPLLNLVSRIERSLDGLGFPKERQGYSPHITLARVKYPQKWTPDVGLFLKSSYDPIDFPVDRVQFFSSELLPTGAVYTLLKSFPLGETV
jgi:2'-5' RNA ligase